MLSQDTDKMKPLPMNQVHFCPNEKVKVIEVWTRQPNGKMSHERFFNGYKPEFYFKRQEDSEVKPNGKADSLLQEGSKGIE